MEPKPATSAMPPVARLDTPRRIILAGVVFVVGVGIFDAIYNLPVITGCAFYGRCPGMSMTEPPTELGESPVQ